MNKETILAQLKELPRKKEELWSYYGTLSEEEHNRLRTYFDTLDTYATELKITSMHDKLVMIKKGFDKILPFFPALQQSYYNTDLYLWYPKIKRFGFIKLPLAEQHKRWEPVNAINMGIRDIRDYYRKLMEDDYEQAIQLVETQ